MALENEMPAEPAAPEPAVEPMPTEGGMQASPEEQALKDEFVLKAWELIYMPDMKAQLIDMLDGDGSGDPETMKVGLGEATSMIVLRVANAAEQAGQELTPDVIFEAGTEILGYLAEYSDAAGLTDYANDRDALEGAYYAAIDVTINPLAAAAESNAETAKADFEKMKAMDDNGELEQVFRKLAAGESMAPEGEEEPSKPAVKGGMGGKPPRERKH